jgi:hypothetical protein
MDFMRKKTAPIERGQNSGKLLINFFECLFFVGLLAHDFEALSWLAMQI